MLALELIALWPQTLPTAGDPTRYFDGNTMAVGDIVKFVCRVTAINLNDPHYGSIQVTPLYPPVGDMFIPDAQSGYTPQSPNFPLPNPQLSTGPFGFHPWQLQKGV